VVPLIVHLSHGWSETIDDLDLVVWGIFTLEYLTLLLSEHREVLERLNQLEGLVMDLRAELVRSRQPLDANALVVDSAELS
jgi:hypothetical protein